MRFTRTLVRVLGRLGQRKLPAWNSNHSNGSVIGKFLALVEVLRRSYRNSDRVILVIGDDLNILRRRSYSYETNSKRAFTNNDVPLLETTQ